MKNKLLLLSFVIFMGVTPAQAGREVGETAGETSGYRPKKTVQFTAQHAPNSLREKWAQIQAAWPAEKARLEAGMPLMVAQERPRVHSRDDSAIISGSTRHLSPFDPTFAQKLKKLQKQWRRAQRQKEKRAHVEKGYGRLPRYMEALLEPIHGIEFSEEEAPQPLIATVWGKFGNLDTSLFAHLGGREYNLQESLQRIIATLSKPTLADMIGDPAGWPKNYKFNV